MKKKKRNQILKDSRQIEKTRIVRRMNSEILPVLVLCKWFPFLMPYSI